jgi:hypothetical protein
MHASAWGGVKLTRRWGGEGRQNEVKGEIAWERGLRPELKGSKGFLIHAVRAAHNGIARPKAVHEGWGWGGAHGGVCQ